MSRMPTLLDEVPTRLPTKDEENILDVGVDIGAALDSSAPEHVFLIVRKHSHIILEHGLKADEADNLADILKIYAYALRRQEEMHAKHS